jgi:hypothetical protein
MEPIIVILEGIEKRTAHIKRKDVATGMKVDDEEIFYTMKLAMKKIKYDRDENVKEGTGDPWMRVSISSKDENTFTEFAGMKMGDELALSIVKIE